MTIYGSIDHTPRTGIADLQTRLVDYAGHVDELRSPEEVLNELHAVTTRTAARSGRGLSSHKVRRLGRRQAREIGLPPRQCPRGMVGGVRGSRSGQVPSRAVLGRLQHGIAYLD